MKPISEDQIAELNSFKPDQMLQWAWQNHGQRAAIFTSFQNTGCVMIDMAARIAPRLRVVTIDTLRLPRETHDVISEVQNRYGIQVERFQPDPAGLQAMLEQHGEFLFFDSPQKQRHCCQVRKVEPNERALKTVDVWIAGLRRDQSDARTATPKAQQIIRDGRPLIKLCPLIDWTEQQLTDYSAQNNVPFNQLYRKGYTSIGCEICSTPTRPGEHSRAGRWRWWNQLQANSKKECGIHTHGSGI